MISTFGTATETDSIVSQITSDGIYGLDTVPAVHPLFFIDAATYTSEYAENTIADQGLITYTKEITTNTAGMAAENQYNVVTDKLVEFIGSDTGRMISDESTLLDGAGTPFSDSRLMLCPFASGGNNWNPAFCNIVEEGSSVDLTIGSLTTGTSQRHIMPLSTDLSMYAFAGWDVPVSDAGVELNYNIKLTGFGDIPATGSAEASMNAHIQEGRAGRQLLELLGPFTYENPINPKAEDMVYSKSTTATGEITLFQEVMNYKSQITAPGGVYVPEDGFT